MLDSRNQYNRCNFFVEQSTASALIPMSEFQATAIMPEISRSGSIAVLGVKCECWTKIRSSDSQSSSNSNGSLKGMSSTVILAQP